VGAVGAVGAVGCCDAGVPMLLLRRGAAEAVVMSDGLEAVGGRGWLAPIGAMRGRW